MIGKLHVLALLVTVANGFLLPLAGRPSTLNVKMSVADAAEACLEEECSLDTVADLLRELKAKSQTSSGQEKAQVMEMYVQLKVMASPKEGAPNQNEIEKLVGAIGRTFGTVEAFEFPGPAIGYSGKPSHAVRADKVLD